VPGPALFLGKALANYVLLLGIECVCLPIFGIFYNIHWTGQPGWLALVMLLGTWGMTVVGTVFSALTVNMRLRELMLPMLVYPIMIPCLMASMQLTTPLLADQPITGDMLAWVRMLVGFDIIFTALAVTLIDTVLVG
jgi:heme exporter protein B